MKLIFKNDGVLWIISKSGRHHDVDDHVSIVVPDDFEPIKQTITDENGRTTIYKTLAEVQQEMGVV